MIVIKWIKVNKEVKLFMAFLKPLTCIILIIGYVGTVLCLQLPINRFADLHLWNFLPGDRSRRERSEDASDRGKISGVKPLRGQAGTILSA